MKRLLRVGLLASLLIIPGCFATNTLDIVIGVSSLVDGVIIDAVQNQMEEQERCESVNSEEECTKAPKQDGIREDR